jgi:hypothetical protein
MDRKQTVVCMIALIAICATYWAVSVLVEWQKLKDRNEAIRRRNLARHNAMDIVDALHSFQGANGRLPFDARGDECALYQLRGMIDIQKFVVEGDEAVEPYWDVEAEAIQNCKWKYLNEKDSRLGDGRVVLVGQENATSVRYVALADFRVIITSPLDDSLDLGDYVDREGTRFNR